MENNETRINTQPIKETVIDSGEASVDTTFMNPIDLPSGAELLNYDESKRYIIIDRLRPASSSGESDIFKCQFDGRPYVLKVYRRKMNINKEKMKALMNISSPYIAPILDYGEYVDRHFEVYYYYESGSLADEIKKRTFSYDELHEVIIPNLVEGLHALHEARLLHRDIKPSNILWKSSSKNSVVLIDFGLSSLAVNNSMSILVSQAGGTFMYSGPEVIRSQGTFYTDESDYYSLGLVIYELFCGKHPFLNAVDAAVSYIIKPQNMPDDLYSLIQGLTYQDISHRNETNNPNRRWTYNEVKKWLAGETLPIPGSSEHNFSGDREITPVPFREHTYTDIDSLCHAMAIDWENGKAFLMRNRLHDRLDIRGNNVSNKQRLWVSMIEDIMENDSYQPDEKLIRVINSLSPNRNYIASPLGCFNTLNELGNHLLDCLDKSSEEINRQVFACINLLISTDSLSLFAKNNPRNGSNKQDLEKFEEYKQILESERWGRQMSSIAYEISFFLSQKQTLEDVLPDKTIFRTVDELKKYLANIGQNSIEKLYETCSYFLDGAKQMKPKVYGWLRYMGCDLEEFNQ